MASPQRIYLSIPGWAGAGLSLPPPVGCGPGLLSGTGCKTLTSVTRPTKLPEGVVNPNTPAPTPTTGLSCCTEGWPGLLAAGLPLGGYVGAGNTLLTALGADVGADNTLFLEAMLRNPSWRLLDVGADNTPLGGYVGAGNTPPAKSRSRAAQPSSPAQQPSSSAQPSSHKP